jgi:hypothetical protein
MEGFDEMREFLPQRESRLPLWTALAGFSNETAECRKLPALPRSTWSCTHFCLAITWSLILLYVAWGMIFLRTRSFLAL